MSSSIAIVRTICSLLLVLSVAERAVSSGVFELELIDLKQLDLAGRPPDGNNQQESAPMRISVCLKEAFTSQLNGPCPFGNATIQLVPSNQQQYSKYKLVNQTATDNDDQTAEQQPKSNHEIRRQRESPTTNLVRILFTFRWTKSFTIILNAEEISSSGNQPHLQSPAAIQRRSGAVVPGILRQGHPQIGDDNYADKIDNTNSSATNPLRPIEDLSPVANRQQSSALAANLPAPFIDRHVLTENEVLPNLELNPNKPWANRFSRNLKSSLAYRFRVYCSLNYYGDGCAFFCRPRDDQFGHYNCSNTGQKVCLDGWTGPDCDKAKCRTGCNSQHGYCDRPDTCQCRPGWTGPRCDECITYPGCQNGYCLNSWQCICQRNWGGVLCDQDLNYCGTHEPCKNGGNCQNIAPGKYKCHCPAGFSGADCELDLSKLPNLDSLTQLSSGCALNPCLNGGTCYGFNGQLVDRATKNATHNCTTSTEIEPPANNPLLSDDVYRCQCPSGWTGDYCQWPDTASLLIIDILNAVAANSTNIPELFNNSTTSTEVSTNSRNEQAESNRTSLDAEKELPWITDQVKSQAHRPHQTSLDMRHLISGVVLASVVGVFIAALLSIWLCLFLLERSKFSLIQMNIVRGGGSESTDDRHCAASTIRRVHNKIRDSFRSSRGRIIPESKLNISHILQPPRPPPSYEESNYHLVSKGGIPAGSVHSSETCEQKNQDYVRVIQIEPKGVDLVNRGALAQKLASIESARAKVCDREPKETITSAQMNCPRHGHIYRHRATNHDRSNLGIHPTELGSLPAQKYHNHHHIHVEAAIEVAEQQGLTVD